MNCIHTKTYNAMGKAERLITIDNFLVATDNQATVFFHPGRTVNYYIFGAWHHNWKF